MTENQYKKLCEACDHILLAQGSTVERVAIQWLHVIREHPVLLGNYQGLFEAKSRLSLFLHKWFHSLRNLMVLVRELLRALYTSGPSWFGQQDYPENADIIFVSHLLNDSQVGESSDFYFGDLPQDLAEKGYSVVIALINHTGQQVVSLTEHRKDNNLYRMIFPNSLNISQEIGLWWRLRKQASRLSKQAKIETDGFLRNVILRAFQEALSSDPLSNLRRGLQIENLVARVKPAAIIVTYEGYSWERVAFSFSRKAKADIRCIGYQHAAVFRLQHAIRRNLLDKYNPDLILTAGLVGKKMLERSGGLSGTPISVLGSNRTFKRTGLNGDSLMTPVMAERTINSVCLVLPEGIATECHLLFDFSLECAKRTPEIKFIWRLHPIINFESLIAQNPKLGSLPSNIYLSTTTLNKDIDQSRWVLYRGTTTVSATVMAGLRPIYLQLPGEMTIDPLYELDVWRSRIKSVSDFNQTIQVDSDCSCGLLDPDLKLAQEYCNEFYTPANVHALIKLLPNIDRVSK